MTEFKSEKDAAYWERNQLVAYLSRLSEAWIEKHPEEDKEWESDWRNIVFIKFPQGTYSWHIHDSELVYFEHLKFREGNSWDGSTTEQKYESLRKEQSWKLRPELSKKLYQELQEYLMKERPVVEEYLPPIKITADNPEDQNIADQMAILYNKNIGDFLE